MDRDNSRTYDIIIIITLKSPTTYIVCTLLHENIHSCSKDCTFFGANNGNVAPSKIHTSLITSTTIPLKKGYWCFAKFAFPMFIFCVCVCVCVCVLPLFFCLFLPSRDKAMSARQSKDSHHHQQQQQQEGEVVGWLAVLWRKEKHFLPLPHPN